ncbi:hypothetical protein ACFQL4_27305 [Halosimplex aquaticum]
MDAEHVPADARGARRVTMAVPTTAMTAQVSPIAASPTPATPSPTDTAPIPATRATAGKSRPRTASAADWSRRTSHVDANRPAPS